MNLADRGAGQRRVVKMPERLVDRASQLAGDGGPHDDGRIVPDGGLQLLQLFGQADADQVGPSAEDLAELDERRPQFGQGQPDAGFACQPAQPLARPIAKHGFGKLEIESAEPIGQSIFAENRENLPRAIDVAVKLGNRRKFHGGSWQADRTRGVGASRYFNLPRSSAGGNKRLASASGGQRAAAALAS